MDREALRLQPLLHSLRVCGGDPETLPVLRRCEPFMKERRGRVMLRGHKIGGFLLLQGQRPEDNLHFLYGASVILTLPLVMSYIVDKKVSRPLAFGLASLFMAGLAIRAITTGGSV